MTKKENLVWRLKEKPSAEGVARLVEQKVITANEGRQILFSESDKKTTAAQEEEIKFLRDLVDKLASKAGGYVTIYEKWREFTPAFPQWYRRYEPIMLANANPMPARITSSLNSNVINAVAGSTSGTQNATYSMSVQAPKRLSSLN